MPAEKCGTSLFARAQVIVEVNGDIRGALRPYPSATLCRACGRFSTSGSTHRCLPMPADAETPIDMTGFRKRPKNPHELGARSLRVAVADRITSIPRRHSGEYAVRSSRTRCEHRSDFQRRSEQPGRDSLINRPEQLRKLWLNRFLRSQTPPLPAMPVGGRRCVVPASLSALEYAPHALAGIARKPSRDHRVAFDTAVVLERQLAVALGYADQPETGASLNVDWASFDTAAFFADFHRRAPDMPGPLSGRFQKVYRIGEMQPARREPNVLRPPRRRASSFSIGLMQLRPQEKKRSIVRAS